MRTGHIFTSGASGGSRGFGRNGPLWSAPAGEAAEEERRERPSDVGTVVEALPDPAPDALDFGKRLDLGGRGRRSS
jgi:hypothetical protein